MPFSLKRFFILLVPVAAGVVAFAANTQISPNKPIINFRLPNFTPDGYRSWLVRGSEASYLPNANQVNVKELTLSVFSGKSDDKLMTMILSPTAKIFPAESIASGENSIRVINDDFEATGLDWRYLHKEKKITIQKKVRVTFNAEIKDFLK